MSTEEFYKDFFGVEPKENSTTVNQSVLAFAEQYAKHRAAETLSELEWVREEFEQYKKANGQWLSPIDSERKTQEEKIKEIFPHYPDESPLWQYLNGLLECTKKYMSLNGRLAKTVNQLAKVEKGRLDLAFLLGQKRREIDTFESFLEEIVERKIFMGSHAEDACSDWRKKAQELLSQKDTFKLELAPGQNLFEALQNVADFTALDDDMTEIVNAVAKDNS